MPKYIDRIFVGGLLSLPRELPTELIELRLVQEMHKAGLDPSVIYAYEKTLLWITEDNVKDFLGRPNFTKKTLDAWEKAQEEYRCQNQ
jgi:hypothetical protein